MVLVHYRNDVYRVKMEALDASLKNLFLEVPEPPGIPKDPSGGKGVMRLTATTS